MPNGDQASPIGGGQESLFLLEQGESFTLMCADMIVHEPK